MQIEEDHRQAFHPFVTAVHESKVRKRRAQLALAHGLTRTRKTSFKAWGQVSRELHRWRCVKRVAYTVLGHLKLYFRFEEWSAESKFRATRRRKIGRVIGRLRDSRRSHAFHAFQEACMHHRGHRNRVKAAVLKMKNHRCHSAFNAFKEFHKHCKTGRSRANRAIKRALMHTEMRAWNVWNEVVGTSKERKTLARKVIARLALRHLHTAFEGFVHALDEHKRRDSFTLWRQPQNLSSMTFPSPSAIFGSQRRGGRTVSLSELSDRTCRPSKLYRLGQQSRRYHQ